MRTDWVKVGTDVAVGGIVGAADQFVQNADDKRGAVGMMSRYGTYLNYGVPILGILGTAMGWLRGEWATRVVLSGSQLAGRKVVHRFTKVAPATFGPRTHKPLGNLAGIGIEF